ncbi:6380_t:CDS:2, partial [Racocetra fulgida]
DYTASQSFLSSRLVFQSTNLPPSNAVYGPKDNGFWTAKKGKTTFPFAFKIPIDAPSSVKYGNNANTLFKSKEAFIVEAWDSDNPLYKTPVDAVNMKQLWMGGPGAVMIESSLTEALFQSGGNVNVKVRVKNDTKRRVKIDEVKIVGETVAEEWFKDKDFCFDCGEDRTTTVHIHVPVNLTVHLPVNIAHSASLQPVPLVDADLNVFPNHYNMMDENTDLFVEDVRKDDSEILGIATSPMNIPSKNGRILPWSDDDVEEDKNNSSSPKGSAISYILGSVSPKGLGALAQSLLGKQKQISPSSPSKLIAKSQPLAPASPYVYIPAIERVRYLSFTTQEQGVIQNRPFDESSKSIISGFGYYDGPHENSPSECEFLNQSSPSKTVQKCQTWLESQQNDSSPDSISVLTESEQITAQGGSSPWAHINKAQEITGALHSMSQTTIPFDQQGMSPITIPKKDTILPEDAFHRNNKTVSSPNGPSGLTLLMRSRPSPSVQDDSSSTSQSYNHISKGRPLPVPTSIESIEDDYVDVQYEEPTLKSDYLQVPGFEQSRPKTPPITAMGATLFKWGTSFIGYKDNKDSQISSESNPVAQTVNIPSTETLIEEEAITARPRRPLPAIPNSVIKTNDISDMPDDKNSHDIQSNSQIILTEAEVAPVTRPRRNLPPIPPKADISSQTKEAKDHDLKPETSNISTANNISLNQTTSVSTTIEHEVTIPQPKVESSDVTSKPESPPKSTKPITKASIFATLGQKPLGSSTSSAQVALPKKTPIVPEKKPVNISSSKQTGFNVPRKPVNRNNPLVGEQNVKLKNDNISKPVVIDNTPLITAARKPLDNDTLSFTIPKPIVPKPIVNNNSTPIVSDVSTKLIDDMPLIHAAKSANNDNIPSLPSLITKPLPEVIPQIEHNESKHILSNETQDSTNKLNDDNNERLSSSPLKDYSKIISEPTTYINTTIAKPIVIADVLNENKFDNKFLRKKRGMRNGKGGEKDEGSLTAKIIEPPKQSVSPRIQEYISKYNQATGGK